MKQLEVQREHEPGDDTVDRVQRAVAILLADEPLERRGEAHMRATLIPSTDHRLHFTVDHLADKPYAFCRIVLDPGAAEQVLDAKVLDIDLALRERVCRSCDVEARRRGYR